MKYLFKNISRIILPVVALGLFGFIGISSAQNTRPPVDVAVGETLPQAGLRSSDGSVLLSRTRTLDSRPDYAVHPPNLELSKYGGWKARRVAATGFFRVEQIDGRWWAVDPEGYLYVSLATNTVHAETLTDSEVYDVLLDNGFNGLGAWSDESILTSPRQQNEPLAYVPKFSFLGEYERRSANLYFPVFDDEFATHCMDYAIEVATQYKDDPNVLGFFSDNEIRWRTNLQQHIDLNDPSDKNYTTAIDFLASRGKTPTTWDEEDENVYLGMMAEAYYSACAAGLKFAAPNHMFLGSRANSSERNAQEFMEAAGRHVDVFSMNHYSRWGSRDVAIHNMANWTGRPLMVTEYFAKESVTGMEAGSGYQVIDQESRGLFYQNYVSTLLESKSLIGFHWFKFRDATPATPGGLANNGIVDMQGNHYTEILEFMREMNSQVYDFIEYADTRPQPSLVVQAEADAFFHYNTNEGDEDILVLDYDGTENSRQSYLRFNLSSLPSQVKIATVDLMSLNTGSTFGEYRAELVSDNSWGENTINLSNNPPGSTVLYEWTYGDDVSIDVTDVVNAALQNGETKLSIRLLANRDTRTIPFYGSSEHANPEARPTLRIHFDEGSGLISWNSSVQVYQGDAADESYVSNNGILVEAINGGGIETTINGVVFEDATDSGGVRDRTSTGGTFTINNSNINATAFTGGEYGDSSAVGEMLKSGFWGVNGVTLNNLTEGNTYEIQLFNNDARDRGNTNYQAGYGIGSGTSGPVGLLQLNHSNSLTLPQTDCGDYLIGTFTAVTTSLTFQGFGTDNGGTLVHGDSRSQINGIQLRDITYVTGAECGDINLDGFVNFLDISPFIALLTSGTFQAEADCNSNGAVDFLDIAPFILALSGS